MILDQLQVEMEDGGSEHNAENAENAGHGCEVQE